MTPAVANAQEVTIAGNELGADACEDPSTSHLQTWWNSSPYIFYGIYIGGDEMGCSQPNLSSSYISAITSGSQEWDLAPVWVGPQAPCTSFTNTFSSNTSTAYTQGYDQAQDAYNEDVALGMGSRVPMNYDLEGFGGTGNSSCVDAAQAFVGGWSDFFVYSGIYGSVVSSALSAYASSSPVPQHIWGAYYDNSSDTNDMDNGASGLSGMWIYNQRIKQYNDGVNETWGGLTMNVDPDSINGPAYAYPPS